MHVFMFGSGLQLLLGLWLGLGLGLGLGLDMSIRCPNSTHIQLEGASLLRVDE
jgi:hypothetical protein